MELQQDALDEAFRRHKNYFQHFLENEVRRYAHVCEYHGVTRSSYALPVDAHKERSSLTQCVWSALFLLFLSLSLVGWLWELLGEAPRHDEPEELAPHR